MIETVAKLVDVLERVLNYMTLRRLGWLLCLLVIGGTSYIAWENRQPIVTSMLANKPGNTDYVLNTVSKETKSVVHKYIDGDPNIAAFQVVGTDFIKLTKNSAFFTAKSREFQRDFEMFQETKVADSALMTMNDDTNNLRIIAIMNQNFVCIPLTPSILRNLPNAPKYAQQICSLSVPPRYGDMVGYLTLWMREEITKEDEEYYKNLARFLASEIYKRDIVSRY